LIESADARSFGLATTAASRILHAADDTAADALGRAIDGVPGEFRFATYLAAMLDHPQLFLQVLILALHASAPRTRYLAAEALRASLSHEHLPADLRAAATGLLHTMARSAADLPVRRAATSALPPASSDSEVGR
jgi:hypothetical protein